VNGFDERKNEILRGLQREASASARRKRALRGGASVCALALAAAGVWWLAPSANTGAPAVAPIGSGEGGGDERIVRASVNLAEYTISDEELVAALDATGEPYTLVWEDGRPRLIEPERAEDAPAGEG